MMGMHAATSGWMWMLMIVCVVGFWLAALLLVRGVTRDRAPYALGGDDSMRRIDPARLLDERLARGEIDLDDYLDRRGLIADYSPRR